MTNDPGALAVANLRKVTGEDGEKSDERLRNMNRRHLEQEANTAVLRGENEAAFSRDAANSFRHYGAVQAISYLSNALRAVNERVEAGRAEIQNMKDRAAKTGQRISAASMGEVERSIARAEATATALGECLLLLNRMATEAKENN